MEFENSNQTVEETPETIDDTQVEDTQQETPVDEASTPQEEEYDIIKYNKEEVKIPTSERQTYLQKGYNYDKIKSELDTTKQQTAYLDRLAKMSGYQNTDEFIKAVEQAEQQQSIQQEAQKMGVDEETYRNYFQPVNDEMSQLKQELQQMKQTEQQRQVAQQVDDLKSRYSDFDDYQDKVFDMAINKGYDLEDAYKLVSYESKLSDIQRQTEDKVVNQIRSRQGKHVETSDQNENVNLNLSPEEIDMAAKMGLSPEEYAKWK